ncbi:MAG: carboxypeptidase regulatory-like domain-containing protein [Actinomycetota bacterium]|nr:carboxypeptidase regulatory-like domain-containing protein [Actinomycetota bacterium]
MQRSWRASRLGVVGLACVCACLAGLLAAPLVAGASTPAFVLEADSYEPDNVPGSADAITLAETQSRTLYPRGDVDWVSFDAIEGTTYDLRTLSDGDDEVDTYMYLYDSDATTVIDRNDDSSGSLFSRIFWTADETKTVYLKVRHFDSQGTGMYALRVRETRLSIHGTVTDEDSTEPLAGASVAAYTWDGAEGAVEEWTYTDEDGGYEFWSLADGTYRLGFFSEGWEEAPYTPEFYNNKASIKDGDDIVVSGGVAPGSYDAALEIMEPSIQGTVVDDDWEDPIPGIAVTAYSWDDDLSAWYEAAWGWTDYYGEYTVYGLKDGKWKIGFQMLWPYYEDEFWMPEFYDDQATVDDAEWVETVDGQVTTGIDASLAPARPAITGTVTESGSGDPLADIGVVAYAYDDYADEWYWVRGVSTDADGSYELKLGSGEYKIGFEDWNPEDGYYQSEYYDDQLHLA